MQRDTFIDVIFEAAKKDKDILWLTADFGAPALDKWKTELPAQFIHCGVSEQTMINVATGLALSGKKPYVFAMSPFFLRAAEQLKVASFNEAPFTVVSVGGGLGYAGAGPSHYALGDIALYRTLQCDLYTASDDYLAKRIAEHTLTSRKLNVVRLERSGGVIYQDLRFEDGYTVHRGHGEVIVTCGYLVDYFRKRGNFVYDVFRLKPLPESLISDLSERSTIVTYEEQYLPGGFGAAIVEALSDHGVKIRVVRKGVPERPIIENGSRDELLEGFWFTTAHHPV